jgi:septum formation protein
MIRGIPKLVLASCSPRRREILSSLGLKFDVEAPEVGENPLFGEAPMELAIRLAKLKAAEVSRRVEGLCVGADTVVDVDGAPFGKPADREDSLRMLRTLSGREHLVHTGLALALRGELRAEGLETTRVMFGNLSETDILDFAANGDGDDKAGAYAIQGRGALLVERIVGCYYNVVGLPAFRLSVMLKELCGENIIKGMRTDVEKMGR